MERLERIGLLARADEFNRLAGDLLERQRAAATGVAVHLRHDHAVKIDLLGEGLSHVHGILAGHGVDDHENLVGLHGGLDVGGLFHHLFVDMQTTRRVDDDHVAQVIDGEANALARDFHRVLAVAAIDFHAHLVAERLQLIGRSRAIHVAGHEQGAVALALQQIRKLGGSGGFTRALQADEHNHVGNAAREHEPRIGLAEQRRELVEHDFHDVLRRRERIEHLSSQAALLRIGDEALDDLEVHVGLEQRHANFPHGRIDVVFSKAALRFQAAENALQAIGEVLKHTSSLLSRFAFVEFAHERSRKIVRVEIFQIAQALAHADFINGQAKLVAHGQRDAALRGAIELGYNHAVQIERFIEHARLRQAILAGGRVNHEHGVHGRLRALAHHIHDLLQLAHKVVRRMQASRRVNEHQIAAIGLGAFDGVVAHACRVASALSFHDGNVRAAGPFFELLDSRSAERVGGTQNNLAAGIGAFLGELADCGGFAGAVNADEQNACGIAAKRIGLGGGKRACKLIIQAIEHSIGIGQRLARGFVAKVFDNLRRCRTAHVGQNERFFQIVPKIVVQIRTAIEQDVHLLGEFLARARKTLADSIKESHENALSCEWKSQPC